MLSNIFNLPFATGLLDMLKTGSNNIKGNWWDVVASFGGALLIVGGIVFIVVAVFKSREKAKWYWSGAIAFVIGAILLMSGSVNMIQGNFSDTWKEVFGGALLYGPGIKAAALTLLGL